MVSKVFEKLVNNKIVHHLEKCDPFLISSMVLGLLDQLQIFSQLCLIELLEVLTGLGLLELWHLMYPKFLTRFGMLVLFTNLDLMEFQVRYLALFLLFSAIDSLWSYGLVVKVLDFQSWMGPRSTQLFILPRLIK